MDGAELQPVRKCLHSFPKLPLWIIEYVWTHKMMDIREVVDPSTWPEMDSQPLSLEESWRLRVTSAQVYSIVKNRDMEHFERVVEFLEATYVLLPSLVAPIKHMKIMFGLKTMAVMWMLREGRGMVEAVFKINQFFPSKLPQYQDQCSPHEMFLMRKNHLDFKTLAQALAMDKNKLEDYIMNEMEQQYGEHYAQKVEDRLLHYLHKLKTVLPGDTYIDKILKKGSPLTAEEKLLLEIINSDYTTITTTLKELLHYDDLLCSLGKVHQSSEHGTNGMKSPQLSQPFLRGSSSKALVKYVEAKTPVEFQPEVFRRGEETDQDVFKKSPLLFENDNDSDVTASQETQEGIEVVRRVEEGSSDKEKEEISQESNESGSTSSPQFCSKHQRWVKSILQECPDECAEALLLQAKVSPSPPLFHSSSSITSSEDLTPSGLVPCPPDQQHPPKQTPTHPQTAAQPCERANSEDEPSSGSPGSASNTSQKELSSRKTLLPASFLPMVRLVDIAPVRGICLNFKLPLESPNHFTTSGTAQAASTLSPQVLNFPHTSGNDYIPQVMMKDLMLDQSNTAAPTNPPNNTHQVQQSPVFQDASTSTSCQPPTRRSTRLARKFRQAFPTTRHSQTFDRLHQNPSAEQFKMVPTTAQRNCLPFSFDPSIPGPPTHDAFTSTSPSDTHISPIQSKTLPCSSLVPSTSSSSCQAVTSQTNRVQRAQLTLSLSSQAMLLQSKLLQPYVSLTRLNAQECCRMTEGRSSSRYEEPVAQGSNDDKDRRWEEEEDADSSFDPNVLYSSHSSSNDDSKDMLDLDPNYKPRLRKKRPLLEYETARNQSHTFTL